MMFGEMFRSPLARLFAHERDEIDGDRERGELIAIALERDEHRGHRAFRIGGSAAPNFSIADFTTEGIDRHVGDADRIKVGTKQNAWSAIERSKAGDEVRATGLDFFDRDCATDLFEPIAQKFGDGRLASFAGAGRIVRIHRRNADQCLQE